MPHAIRIILIFLLLTATLRAQQALPTPAPVGPPAPPAPVLNTALLPVLQQRMNWALKVLDGDLSALAQAEFTDEFRANVPPEQFAERLTEAMEVSGGFTVLFTRHLDYTQIGAWLRANNNLLDTRVLRIRIDPDPPHAISSFELEPTAPLDGAGTPTWEALDSTLDSQRFTTAYMAAELMPDGELRTIQSRDPTRPMSLGTAGIIYSHLALTRLVGEGGADWNQKLFIDRTLKSVPESRSSRLEDGTELSLNDLARRVLLERDATATNHLVNLIGRDRIEHAISSIRGVPLDELDPFLTITEFLRIKSSVTDILMRYAEASPSERRDLLDTEVQSTPIDQTILRAWRVPQEIGRIGWQASPDELVRIGAELWKTSKMEGQEWALGALQAPNLPQERMGPWKVYAAASGGEIGAASMLWIAERNDGRVFIMAFANNDPKRALPQRTIEQLHGIAFGALQSTR